MILTVKFNQTMTSVYTYCSKTVSLIAHISFTSFKTNSGMPPSTDNSHSTAICIPSSLTKKHKSGALRTTVTTEDHKAYVVS